MRHPLVFLILLLVLASASAQIGIRSGFMHIRQTDQNSISLQIDLYFDYPGHFRDSINISWGDGFFEALAFTDFQLDESKDLRKVSYAGEHIYPSSGPFRIETYNCCWSERIVNIENPSDKVLQLSNRINLVSHQFGDYMESPAALYEINVYEGVVGQPFNFDFLHESASELPIHTGYAPSFDTQYQLPWEVGDGAPASFSFDQDGAFMWSSPKVPGDYSMAIRLLEIVENDTIQDFVYPMSIHVSNTTTTEELSADLILVGSNPGSGHLVFTKAFKMLRVYQTDGQLMRSYEGVDRLDLSEYSDGSYLIWLDDEEMQYVHRYIKH